MREAGERTRKIRSNVIILLLNFIKINKKD